MMEQPEDFCVEETMQEEKAESVEQRYGKILSSLKGLQVEAQTVRLLEQILFELMKIRENQEQGVTVFTEPIEKETS